MMDLSILTLWMTQVLKAFPEAVQAVISHMTLRVKAAALIQ